MNAIGSPTAFSTLAADAPAADALAACYQHVRSTTMSLCAPLEVEDYVVQSMPDASPVKWHLAHTSWFFETFVLKPADADLEAIPSQYGYLFNSYYNAIGERIARPDRGLLSRPTVAEVCRYRAAIDDAMRALLDRADDAWLRRLGATIVLGLHHEQQHQELILTDLKHAFGRNPLRPIYRDIELPGAEAPGPIGWLDYPAGLRRIGHDGPGFAFDNESPRHQVFVVAFRLADRLVTNGDYLAFIEDGGYERPEFWLSDGWNARNAQRWTAPLYWERSADGWRLMTLAGLRDLDEAEPVCHVSYYEADAFARWSGARLPSEAEWEVAAEGRPVEGNFLEGERFHPAPLAAADAAGSPSQLFGDVWEWTRSPYSPYPGYQPATGALGEYNGKFMCNQMVLRGGSCATPALHIRSTYRNFFPPDARWQFSGIRLARDV
jgi:ergothioneine biosynthesis protein EgtB